VSLFDEITSGRRDICWWAEEARKIGYEGIDISIMFLKNRTPTYLAALKNGLERIGKSIVMMTTYPDFTNPDPVQRGRELEYLVADVALSSEIGIPYLRILAGQAHPGTSLDDGIGYIRENFEAISAYGKKYGVGLLLEDHAKPGAWDLFDFSYNPEVFLRICEEVRDLGIRVNFDTGNIVAYGMDPIDVLPKVFDMVETIHVTDMSKKGVFSPTGIGDGIVPNREIFSYLKKRGFDGWICIEEASGRGLEGIAKAREFVKKAWQEA
jgi:sugar phosphate isomerase/epimerase